MKILINGMSLTERGTYTLLVDFLQQMKLKEDYLASRGISLHFLVASKGLERYEGERIKVQYEFSSKKGLINRLYYEKFVLPGFMKENEIDVYLCLQNTSLYSGEVPQFMLIQQPLLFSGLKFCDLSVKLYVKYCLLMNFISKFTINRNRGIIVQTNWVKNAIISEHKYGGEVRVIRPALRSIMNCNAALPEKIIENLDVSGTKFVYVTSDDKYKNVDRLVEAVKRYNAGANADLRVTLFLTIEGESEEGICYLGRVPYEALYNMYKSVDVLIFPSLTETLGLPLQEAMNLGLPVLAADLPYAREVCGDYANYFEPRDVDSIAKTIGDYMNGKYSDGRGTERRNAENSLENNSEKDNDDDKSSYMDYIDFILELYGNKK